MTNLLKQIAARISKNRVQQNWVTKFLTIFETETDDIYDFANLIAALRKTANFIEEKTQERFGENNKSFYIEQAMKDWPKNQSEEPINETKQQPNPPDYPHNEEHSDSAN